ncbi:hypothetical protein BJY00DRAFT_324894 [Aspergillus carlsbadensis]|nr:hypothetical protein BJY00DRAFT_324894 [Aspergillus carlsbadensis]
MQSEEEQSRSVTFIHGPTIRGGARNASLIRSQLMRQRRWENRGSAPKLPVCRCGRGASTIASSRIDPFLADHRKTSSNFDLLPHHCVYVLWPMARPTEFAERNLQAYLHPARNPMVMQSMLYSASLHRDALLRIRGATERASSTAQQLRLKGSVMNEIRQKLSTMDSESIHEDWVDDILMSILYLAANENIDQIGQPEKSPFAAPFRSLQLMEYYGSCEFHPLHWQTVQHIVLERGGLSAVKLHGLAWLMSISGLIVAVDSSCKPVFPLISPEGKLFIYRAPLVALSIRTPPRHVTQRNHGFQQLALLSPPIKGSIIRVFLDLNEISQALNILAGQPCGSRLLTQIGDARASVLHRLCSLPDHTDRPTAILHKRQCSTEEQSASIAVYLICRRTALLYAAHVVLPLPKTSPLRREMTAAIYEAMIRLEKANQAEQQSKILLWCCVIGGICSDATPDIRAWFVAQARAYCRVLDIASWSAFLDFMQSFSWLDSASDKAGEMLWAEMGICGGGQDEMDSPDCSIVGID